jgi:ribosomal protein L32
MAPLPKRKISKARRDRRRNHDKIKSVSNVAHKRVIGRKFSAKERTTDSK